MTAPTRGDGPTMGGSTDYSIPHLKSGCCPRSFVCEHLGVCVSVPSLNGVIGSPTEMKPTKRRL